MSDLVERLRNTMVGEAHEAADRIEALEIALGNMIEHYINAAASVDCYGDPNTDNVVREARAILKEVANV